MNREIWVYDIETLKSCFTYTAINVDTEEIVSYVLHKDKFELIKLIAHLNSCKGQVGFNNINFDYPIIHFILTEHDDWLDFSNEETIDLIYRKAQWIIEIQNQENFNEIVAIRTKDVKIPQLDLFKLWHYNNKARRTSLKALQISMNYPNVMESPIEHTKDDITLEEVKDILEYNLNDVLSTYEFYKKSREKINLRQNLKNKFNLKCTNFSDSKIGESLMLKLYCEKTNKDYWEVKQQRTYRNEINFNDCILPYIQFKSKEFSDLLQYLRNQKITNTKGAIEESVIYKEFKYDFGTGGIHGCIKPGVYESGTNYLIVDADVGLNVAQLKLY